MKTLEQEQVEYKEPIPLESLPLPRAVNVGKELEKGLYWNKLLTGNPETVPADIRQKVGAQDESLPAEARNYRLMNSINRSWVVDHRGLSRDQVRSEWPELRRNMSRELGVRDDEAEVYTALSVQNEEAPLRRKARDLYAQSYKAALEGKDAELPEDEVERSLYADAWERGAEARETYLPLAETVSEAWSLIKSLDSEIVTPVPILTKGDDLWQAVDKLADMEPEERARVYAVALSLESTQKLKEKPGNLGAAVVHSMRRGADELRHSLVQGIGHASTALLRAAGETLDSDKIRGLSTAADKRLQTLHELRRLAQGELFPIDLGKDAGLAEQMLVDAAGAVPGTVLAFAGGAGFATLTVAGTGGAVAEARSRAPEGRQELQTAAGILGGALQAGIYMGMTRIGAQMLNRTINGFLKAANSGVKGYSLAALKGLAVLTAENAKLLMAGKAAQLSELGMQELAARVDNVASNIDWESFGNNFTDIEANMREAAMNLPFVLIAAGRAALHHFRSPSNLLDNGELLAEWGVNETARKRILDEADIHVKNDLLRQALYSSSRWGGTGALDKLIRSLKLLNTEHHVGFREDATARDFLNKRADQEGLSHPKLETRDTKDPETFTMLVERATGRTRPPLNADKSIPYLLLYDEWFQRAHGNMKRDRAQRIEYDKRMVQVIKNKSADIPLEAQLNGVYSPYQEEAIRAMMSDYVLEVKKLSYRYLLNTESLDSLRRAYKSENDARQRTEQRRYRIPSEVCAAIDRWMKGMPREQSLKLLSDRLADMYFSHRRHAKHAPRWMQELPSKAFTENYDKAYQSMVLSANTKDEPMREAYRIMISARACAEALMEIIPHTRDFQDALCLGYAPDAIYAHLLRREFEGNLDPGIWDARPLPEVKSDMGDNRSRFLQNKKVMLRYSELSGNNLESTADGKGGKLWRIRRPDGRYTQWFNTPGHALNSLVGNVDLTFLPMRKNRLFQEMRRGMVRDELNRVSYLRRRMFDVNQRAYLGYDHLCNTATRELFAQWMGDATMFKVGLDFVREYKDWKRAGGHRIDYNLKLAENENDHYLVRHNRPLTPLALAQMSFRAYWTRLLTSGWVSPEEVGDFLVSERVIPEKYRDRILRWGKERKVGILSLTGPRRREIMRRNPELLLPADHVKMSSRLATHMADLNLWYMLANLTDAQLPDSVKQWFLTAPFSKFTVPEQSISHHERLVKNNRQAAEEVKSMISRVNDMRQRYGKDNPIPFEKYMKAAYEPNEPRRYEQGWCFALGGEHTFLTSGQSLWNMLDEPVRGWKLLPELDRTQLTAELSDLFASRSPEECMQELADVLERYPQLRAYGMVERGSNELARMLLDPVKTSGIVETDFTKKGNKLALRPDTVQRGYTLEKSVELPAECREDARVMPALRLLSELRRSVTMLPYRDQEGIWWKQERYGGVDGKRPGRMDERWAAETGLSSFVQYYNQVAERIEAENGDLPLWVCGVNMGGIRPGELDMSRLQHVTVYRAPHMPEQMVRLMPGIPDSFVAAQRTPYVVQTADGIPLLKKRLARSMEDVEQAITPLRNYDFDLERMYDYETNSRWRRRQLNANLRYLINLRARNAETWEKESQHGISNEELFMQIFQDSRLSYYLQTRDPAQLTRGEALACELSRRMLLAEYGHDREAHVQSLVEFCKNLRDEPQDIARIQSALNRMVSPTPDRYVDEDAPMPKNEIEGDVEDVELD